MNHLFPAPGSLVPAWARLLGCHRSCCASISLALLGVPFLASAGNFQCDFNSGLPPNAKVYGDTKVVETDGVENSGVLQLTTARRNQLGSFIIDPLDGNTPVTGFTATFKALIGGGSGADGFGFLFGKDIPDKPFPEIGYGAGLIITFDTFNNGVGEITPGVRVLFKNKLIYNESVPDLEQNRFVDVRIHYEGGMLEATYDNRPAITNLFVGAKTLAGRFAFSSRTGGSTDNHFIDDLKITTRVSYPFLKSFGPSGDNVAPDAPIELVFRDFDKSVSNSSIRLLLDGREVPAQIVMNDAGVKSVRYEPSDLLKPGSIHAVLVTFVNRADPSVTTEASYSFAVSSQIILSRQP